MTTTYRTSRRNFLKTGATIGGVLVAPAFSARVFAETVKDGQTIITAAHWGPLAVVVKDGKIQSSAPAIEDLGDNPLQTVVARPGL
jgi:trimethylamine-N-oxide reductase